MFFFVSFHLHVPAMNVRSGNRDSNKRLANFEFRKKQKLECVAFLNTLKLTCVQVLMMWKMSLYFSVSLHDSFQLHATV